MGDKCVQYLRVNFGNTVCKPYVFIHLKSPKIFTDHVKLFKNAGTLNSK